MSGTSPVSASVTAEVVNPLVHGVRHVFETDLRARTERTGLERLPQRLPHHVNAVVDLTGRTIGRFWVGFPGRTARAAAARLRNRPVSEVDDLIEEALCELLGAAVDEAKGSLERLRLVAVPPQVLPAALANRFPHRSTPMRAGFRSTIGPFFVAFGFARLVAEAGEATQPELTSDQTAAVERLLD